MRNGRHLLLLNKKRWHIQDVWQIILTYMESWCFVNIIQRQRVYKNVTCLNILMAVMFKPAAQSKLQHICLPHSKPLKRLCCGNSALNEEYLWRSDDPRHPWDLAAMLAEFCRHWMFPHHYLREIILRIGLERMWWTGWMVQLLGSRMTPTIFGKEKSRSAWDCSH